MHREPEGFQLWIGAPLPACSMELCLQPCEDNAFSRSACYCVLLVLVAVLRDKQFSLFKCLSLSEISFLPPQK